MHDTTHTARLVYAASGHACALARISAHTATGLLAITGALEISHLPAVQRSVQRERRRADLYRGLARDLQCVKAPGADTSLTGSRAASPVPPLDLLEARATSGHSGWLALIALRQWNLHHCAKHRDRLDELTDALVPSLQARADLHAQTAASRLLECRAASRLSPDR
ncbi:MAG: hypothetical protein ACEQSX_05755 [Baekduiaceae bacterium]